MDVAPYGCEKFYVYLHSRPCGGVFYVGKGSGNRSHDFVKNRNKYYLRTVAKIGRKNVQVSVFPCESESNAFEMEVIIIDVLRSANHRLVNLTDGGDGVRGYAFTDEARAKMSAAQKGKVLTVEHRAKMSASRTGRVHSQETRDRISAANAGKRRAPFSEEVRRNMSAALMGRPVSEETRQRMVQAQLGKKASPEARNNMSASHTGLPWSAKRREAFERKKNGQ